MPKLKTNIEGVNIHLHIWSCSYIVMWSIYLLLPSWISLWAESMGVHRCIWCALLYMDMHGCVWVCTGVYRCAWWCVWMCTGMYGCTRVCVGVHRCVWVCTGVYGWLLVCMGVHCMVCTSACALYLMSVHTTESSTHGVVLLYCEPSAHMACKH